MKPLVILAIPIVCLAQSTTALLPVSGITRPYRTPRIDAIRLENTARIDSFLQDGKIYLSLQGAIDLALENNLDLELVRDGRQEARTDLMRAQAGSSLRGIPLSVREGPAGLGTPEAAPDGTLGGGNTPALNTLIGPGVQTDLSILGSLPLSTGPAVPAFDPVLTGNVAWNHSSDPQNNVFLPDIRSLNARTTTFDFGFAQGLATGASLFAGWNNQRQSVSSPLINLSPATTSSLGVTLDQPLLRGFGPAVNRRYVRIAKNNLQIADYVFQEQVIVTVSNVVRLYWDLASLNEDVGVREDAVASAERLLSDTKAQVETGTAATIDVTRAEAERARRNRDLDVARSLVREQEVVLKDYLTRSRLNAKLEDAPIVLLDHLTAPAETPNGSFEDLVGQSLKSRPDVAQARLQIVNSQISLKGSTNALKPQLDLIASVQNNGLSGRPLPGDAIAPDALSSGLQTFLVGGYGSALGQIFKRNFPDYGVGVQLTIPLRNRTARSDVIRDELSLRDQQIRFQQLEKQVRLEVRNALIAVDQAHRSFEAAHSESVLQEQALAAEREKYAVGASTGFYVMQYQRDLAASQSAEISTLAGYQKARTALERAVGTILDDYGITMGEATSGTVSRGGKE